MLVSPRMMADHLPDRLCKVLQRLSRARARLRRGGGDGAMHDGVGPNFRGGAGNDESTDNSDDESAAAAAVGGVGRRKSARASAAGVGAGGGGPLSSVAERGPGGKRM